MFNRSGKKLTPKKGKSLKDLSGITTPEQLLSDPPRQKLLEQIKALSSFQPNRFDSLCKVLVHHLINHCQKLPETLNSYYSNQGGVLDYALNRTEAALHLFREFVVSEETLSEEQKLWLYALLTAALLQGIGKLKVDYLVEIYDLNGQKLKKWNPVLESLSSVASYYHYQIEGNLDIEYRKRLNLLIARLLMPTSGFEWIASDPEVLRVWLALIDEDWESAGTLGALLVRADAIAIQRNLLNLKFSSRGARSGRIGAFMDTHPENLAEREMQTGVEFINWLRTAIEKGILMINKAPLFMVPGGMLMSPDLFKLFVREHPEFKNWQAIQSGFLSLGVHAVNADGAVTSKFEQANTQHIVNGAVFEKYAVALPNQVNAHSLNTGKVSQVSALNLINQSKYGAHFSEQGSGGSNKAIERLSAEGKWVPADDSRPNLSPGGNLRG